MFYADDLQMYLYTLESSDSVMRLQDCTHDVKVWTTTNGLLLNDAKTEIIHFSSRFVNDLDRLTSFSVGTCDVATSSEARNLGVVMDQHLTLTTHVNNICRSACLAIAKIGQIRKYIDQPTAERLVHAFVTSRLDANNSLLYGLPAKDIAKLQRVQNCAVRLVTLDKTYTNIDAVRRDKLHWLPIRDRIIFKILLLTFKAMNNLAPQYISDLLVKYTPCRTLRSSSGNFLVIPSNREVSTAYYGDRAFSSSAPTLWNKLPRKIRNATSVDEFKTLLKTHLFKKPSN